ncbi:hypothetical protein X551_00817 [Methylibium sp. T29]|nr:hypothetical protein T29Apl_00033 [Methylibium sp. T29]AIA99173.1 hypothetical protein T29Bpl_00039 [Methylibium sp. T29-B]EWS56338.1 hypothetical protein X551_00817 [Methylibium sp. T29]EWS60849.1 hypothetical protein Y694_01366 [Methylibium sp. T29-B]
MSTEHSLCAVQPLRVGRSRAMVAAGLSHPLCGSQGRLRLGEVIWCAERVLQIGDAK